MKRKRFSVEQIVAVLKQAEMGVPVTELIRQVELTCSPRPQASQRAGVGLHFHPKTTTPTPSRTPYPQFVRRPRLKHM